MCVTLRYSVTLCVNVCVCTAPHERHGATLCVPGCNLPPSVFRCLWARLWGRGVPPWALASVAPTDLDSWLLHPVLRRLELARGTVGIGALRDPLPPIGTPSPAAVGGSSSRPITPATTVLPDTAFAEKFFPQRVTHEVTFVPAVAPEVTRVVRSNATQGSEEKERQRRWQDVTSRQPPEMWYLLKS